MTADKLAELKSNVLSFPFEIRHYREALKGISYVLFVGHFPCICDEGQCQFTEYLINILERTYFMEGTTQYAFCNIGITKLSTINNIVHFSSNINSDSLKLGCTTLNIQSV